AVTLHRMKVRFIESIRAINKSHQNVQTDLVRSCLCLASEGGSIGILRRTKEGDGADARSDLTQDFETLPGKIGSRVGDAGEVSAGMRQAFDQTGRQRVRDLHRYESATASSRNRALRPWAAALPPRAATRLPRRRAA